MRKTIYFLIFIFFLSGCVTLKNVPTEDSVDQVKEHPPKTGPVPSDTSPELQNIKGERLEEYTGEYGVVFAKTDFQGVLKTSYVKLLFEDREDSKNKFQLHIGNKAGEQSFPWDVKTVMPGYFFIELPVGKYKISSISIPVGTTMATEAVDINLEVIPNSIVYIGTLKIIGTKEKIKLGGVPVIKPGFEYVVEILDEREEGMTAFQQRYPNYTNEILVNLMNVNTL